MKTYILLKKVIGEDTTPQVVNFYKTLDFAKEIAQMHHQYDLIWFNRPSRLTDTYTIDIIQALPTGIEWTIETHEVAVDPMMQEKQA